MYIPIPISDDELNNLILKGPHEVGAGVYALAKELQRARFEKDQERERCAQVVENALRDHYEKQHGQKRGLSEAEVFLAKAIRQP